MPQADICQSLKYVILKITLISCYSSRFIQYHRRLERITFRVSLKCREYSIQLLFSALRAQQILRLLQLFSDFQLLRTFLFAQAAVFAGVQQFSALFGIIFHLL